MLPRLKQSSCCSKTPSFLKNINKNCLLFATRNLQAEPATSLPSLFISWTCVSSRTSAISHWLEQPVRFQRNTDGSQMGRSCQTDQLFTLPEDPDTHNIHTLPSLSSFPLPLCRFSRSVTRALCQLMSLRTHLPVAFSQIDINVLKTCNFFMANNNDIGLNLSGVPKEQEASTAGTVQICSRN